MFQLLNTVLQLIAFAGCAVSYAAGEPEEPEQSRHGLSLAAYRADGDFGLAFDTEILFVPLRYEFDRGNWGFQLSVPYLQITGPGAVLLNLGGVNPAVTGGQRQSESGIGDVLGSVVYRLEPIGAAALFADLRLDLKLPTADAAKGLGTGETDFNLQLDLSQYRGAWVVFATAGYSFRGDSALFPQLQSGAYAQAGAARSVQESIAIGVLYDYRQAASSLTADIQEIGPYLSWQLNDHWSFTGLAMTGMSRSSADFSVLAQLRYGW